MASVREGVRVMDGFGVTVPDLERAAAVFSTQAKIFAGSMPAGGPAAADGGGAVINDALSLVLQTVGLLHEQLTATISQDGGNLRATGAEYQRAEDAIIRVVTAVAPGPAR
jgi:hypothetical protein